MVNINNTQVSGGRLDGIRLMCVHVGPRDVWEGEGKGGAVLRLSGDLVAVGFVGVLVGCGGRDEDAWGLAWGGMGFDMGVGGLWCMWSGMSVWRLG